MDLPARGTRNAPKTFKGKYTRVEGFIRHYEKLLSKYNITDNSDKCNGILEYVTLTVKTLILSTTEYQANDWKGLKKYLLKVYDAERARFRYKPSDVLAYAKKHSNKTCDNLTKWLKYSRKYQALSGTLYQQNKLSELEYHGFFWLGIPEKLRAILEDKLDKKFPLRDAGAYKKVEEVNEVAEKYFSRDKFTSLIASGPYIFDIPSEDEDSDEDSSSDSDSDLDSSSDSDSDDDKYHKKSHRSHKRSKRRRSVPDITPKLTSTPNMEKSKEGLRAEVRAHRTKPQGSKDEVAEIIHKLSNLKVDDPSYPAVYYQALRLDKSGAIEKCFQTPQSKRQEQRSPKSTMPNQTQNQSENYRRPRIFEAQQPRPSGCYGCGLPGHTLSECQVMKERLTRGEVVIEPGTRRYTFANGNTIRRQAGESIAQAVDRTLEQRASQAVQSLLVTMPRPTQTYLANIPPVDFSDSDHEDTSSDEWEDEYWQNERDSFEPIEEVDGYESEPERDMFEERSQYYEVSDSEEDDDGIVYEVSKKDIVNDRKSREARLQAAKDASLRPKRIAKVPKQADGTNVDWRKTMGKGKNPELSHTNPNRFNQLETQTESQLPSMSHSQIPKISEPRTDDPVPVPKLKINPNMEVLPKKILQPIKSQSNPPPIKPITPRLDEDAIMKDMTSSIPREPKPIDVREIRKREVRHELLEQDMRSRDKDQNENSHKPQLPTRTYGPPVMKRQSELSSNIDPKTVVGRLMNTEVTLPIKEVLGTSGEVCKHLGEMICLKNPREPRVFKTTTRIEDKERQYLRKILAQALNTISAHKAGQVHLI